MDKVIIELTGDNSLKALKELENRKLIRILRNPKQASYALAGEPVSEVDFKNWIEYAENTPTLSLNEAKQLLFVSLSNGQKWVNLNWRK